jgi:signal transduction histidine kinase
VQFCAEIAKRVSLSVTIQEAFDIINDANISTFEAEQSAIFSFDEKNNIYIRKAFKNIGKPSIDVEFPVYLKLSQLFEPYSQKKILTNSNRPSPFFESDPFKGGSEMLLPVRIGNRVFVLVVCRSSKKILLTKDQESYCNYLESLVTITLRRFTYEHEIEVLKSEIHKRDEINNDKLHTINERLKQSNRELKQFAYMASHDLQEPLRMVTNYINLFYKYFGNTLSEQGKEYLDFAKDGAGRMHMLIKDLLTYARLDYDENPKLHFNGNKMLSEVLQNLQVAIEENNALVFYQDMPELYGNENQLMSLFQNLIDNGIKYKGTDAPNIFIDVNESNEVWNFKVKDNGIGIEKQFHDKIFEFFTRLHSKDEYKGTGLGLSICKKIIEKHAGNISVDSSPGMGATFKFSLAKM